MSNNETNAKAFYEAIKKFTENPAALENLENYLSHHFDVWVQKYAYDPESLTSELNHFASIEI